MTYRVDTADAREWLPSLVGHVDPARTVIITDPPWPGVGLSEDAGWNPAQTWREVAPWFPRLCRRLIVQIGCLADPRELLAEVPLEMPFVRTCWLRFAVPMHRGPLLQSGDVAYVFGDRTLAKGQKQLPGECRGTGYVEHRSRRTGHPCPRREEHVEWLIRWFTRPGELVVDPFTGSGTTGGGGGAARPRLPRVRDRRHLRRSGTGGHRSASPSRLPGRLDGGAVE